MLEYLEKLSLIWRTRIEFLENLTGLKVFGFVDPDITLIGIIDRRFMALTFSGQYVDTLMNIVNKS